MLPQTPSDPHALALSALTATLTDERRSRRFLELTGIGTDELRRQVNSNSLLAALLRFLEGHEPDLLAVCEQLGIKPDALIAARRALEEER